LYSFKTLDFCVVFMQDRGWWWWVGAKEDLWCKGGFMVQRRIYGAKEDLWGKGGFMGQRRIYGAKEDLWGKGGFMGQLTLLLSICMVNQLLI
jgi:hypothetical protein